MWIGIAVPTAIGLLMLVAGWSTPLTAEQCVRYVGGLLEFAGVCTVALGVRDTRKLFKRPSFRKAIRNWFTTIPRWRQHRYVQAGCAKLRLTPMSAQAYATAMAPASATIEQRITALESEVKNLSGRIQASRVDFETKITQQKDALATEQRERTEQVEATRKLIDEAVAGGLVIEMMGLVWLVLGLVLATASDLLVMPFG